MIKFLKKHKLLSIVLSLLIVLDITVIVLALKPSNMDVTTPGGLNEVKSVIKANTDVEIKGSFNTIYVYSIERTSYLQMLIASLSEYNEVEPSSDIFHLSEAERVSAGKVQKNQSIEASLICAYNVASKNNTNITINYKFCGFIIYNYQINNFDFQIGDIITSFYDKDTNTLYEYDKEPKKLYEILNKDKKINKYDVITIIRDGKLLPIEIEKELSYYENSNRIYVYPKYEIYDEDTYPKYTLYKSNTLGPSGGLMQTLSVYSQITGDDLTYGHKIAGTGTIEVDGTVGRIGGISQKIVTAINNNADVFLCPKSNELEAVKTYEKVKHQGNMKLIIVETFEQAVNELRGLYESK